MNDRDDFAELVGSARNVTKCSSFYFYGRIRYGTKGEKVEERFLCMDHVRVYICSIKIPVKIESQFNILSIKSIERLNDSHIIIETDAKQSHSLYSLHDKASLQPFLIILIRTIRAVFPHRLQAIVDIRPENEYDRLLRLSNEYFDDKSSDIHICGGFSHRYECACDFYQTQCHRSVQNLVDTVFAHRASREFTFREFESFNQKDWLPIIGALRHNEWFIKLTIENTKLSSENIDELCVTFRLNKTIKDLRLVNCGLKQDFVTRFANYLPITNIENFDLSNNTFEDKGLNVLSTALQQRKLPLRSFNLQSCSITHKSLYGFNSSLINNNYILKNLKILDLSGNRIKEENCITILFSNNENVLEELHLSDIEFNLESFFYSLAALPCKLRRLYITSIKSSISSSISGGVKSFFTKTQLLEILQLSNANLSNDFLRELCEGLHSNMHLKNLDLCLSGNQLESFIHECASRFATIPCLNTLDISGCDLDTEVVTLLIELKKNQKLKSLHIGRNFNNTKPKNLQRIVSAMKDLVFDSKLEYLSIADSKLRENTADFLQSLVNNTSIKTLDIRGNLMSDTGARSLTHVIQMNRHLHTIFYDRNVLSLNNFEDIVNAMEENYVIQYLPVPMTDIILMKTSEKERMEKLQFLINKLDSLCIRNQEQNQKISSTDSLLVTTTANLAHEMTLSWENQQQLFADQLSLEYIQSCSNRPNNKNDELKSMLTRPVHINEVSSQLYDLYLIEEERLKDDWQDVCKLFEQRFIRTQENLSKKYYQLFKEQLLINYDDKFQDEIRTYFLNSNNAINHLLNHEIPAKIASYTRECYINVATCLQRRAYDTMNEMAYDMHKQLESTILRTATPSPQTSAADGQQHPSSTIDRLVNRGANVVHRLAHNKHGHPQPELIDETINNRPLKTTDSNEYLADPPPKTPRSTSRDNRLLPSTSNKVPPPTSPKQSSASNRHRSVLNSTNESEPISTNTNPIYNNFSNLNRTSKQDISLEDEANRIEHDLLDIVEQERQKDQQKNIPPNIPAKKRLTSSAQDDPLDIDLEPTTRLVHLGKDRPRRDNVRRPVKRTDGTSHDSSSDGGLDNDDNSIGDIPPTSTIETSNINPSNISTIDPPPITELPPKTVTKFKAALKSSKTSADESSPPPPPPPIPAKTQQSTRSSNLQQQTSTPLLTTNISSKSTIQTHNDTSQVINSDSICDPSQIKPSLSLSSQTTTSPLSNKDDQKETYNSLENIPSSHAPPVLARTGKVAIGTRVLPISDPSGEAPPVRLRHLQSDRKDSPTGSDATSGAGDLSTSTDSEKYKRLSVKERARMLTTPNAPMTLNDKKTATSPSNTTGK
ncbi:unnamed protein product [Rotaria sordida]|nr:unnamed protein product [Rotaria sordida]